MDTLVIYAPKDSSRFRYVTDWLFGERLRVTYTICTDKAQAEAATWCIAYGVALPNAYVIPDAGLLWDTDVKSQVPETGEWAGIPTIFNTTGGNLPFDIFSAIFYLISRYEEYLPYKPDQHGRYPATASILYRKGWLMRPLVDEWITALAKQLRKQAPTWEWTGGHFAYRPTYDIDIAYSHLHKGVLRIVGAYIKAILKVDIRQITERTQVLKYKQKDPYDSFRWLRQMHKEYDLKPTFFVLAAERTTRFDKNINPRHPAMLRIIRNLSREGVLGMHPSYYAGQNDAVEREKKLLEEIGGKPVLVSRQHYMRLKLPDTCQLLLRHNITDDYSMGYGSHLGFRAATGNSFLWFNLRENKTTTLRMHPFCFMDTAAHFGARLSVSDAFAHLEAMSQALEKTGSTLITVFHNFSLGTAQEWKGWRQAYEHFLTEKSKL